MSKTLVGLYENAQTRGEMKVKKAFTVLLSQMYIEPGSNVRFEQYTVDGDELSLQHPRVESLINAYLAGEPIPPIVVEVQPDGRLKVVAGHRRFTALNYIVRVMGNTDFERTEVRQINADTAGLIKFQVGENKGKNLGPVDEAVACQQLRDLDMTPAEIAELLDYSESKVNYCLTIAKMSNDVKQAIVDGKIAADFAADIFRKKGDAGVLAVLQPGEKVTRKSAGLWRPSMGKSVVSLFTGLTPVQNSDNSVTITLDADKYAVLQEAIAALGKSEGVE